MHSTLNFASFKLDLRYTLQLSTLSILHLRTLSSHLHTLFYTHSCTPFTLSALPLPSHSLLSTLAFFYPSLTCTLSALYSLLFFFCTHSLSSPLTCSVYPTLTYLYILYSTLFLLVYSLTYYLSLFHSLVLCNVHAYVHSSLYSSTLHLLVRSLLSTPLLSLHDSSRLFCVQAALRAQVHSGARGEGCARAGHRALQPPRRPLDARPRRRPPLSPGAPQGGGCGHHLSRRRVRSR